MNIKTMIISAALALGLTSIAHAADITGNLTILSDYRYRGVSQTLNGPEVSGNIDFTTNSGFYAGTFISNVSSEYYTHGAGYEEDFYGGFKKEVVKGVTLDVGSYTDTYYKAYEPKNLNYTTSEVYTNASYGPLTLGARYAFTTYFGIARSAGTKYVSADFSQPIGPVTLIAHAAHTFVPEKNYDYNDLNAGVAFNLPKNFSIQALYYVNTDLGKAMMDYNTVNGNKLYSNAVVLSLKKSF